eukprot:PhM_4_TR18780/c0_g2_i1/m.21480
MDGAHHADDDPSPHDNLLLKVIGAQRRNARQEREMERIRLLGQARRQRADGLDCTDSLVRRSSALHHHQGPPPRHSLSRTRSRSDPKRVQQQKVAAPRATAQRLGGSKPRVVPTTTSRTSNQPGPAERDTEDLMLQLALEFSKHAQEDDDRAMAEKLSREWNRPPAYVPSAADSDLELALALSLSSTTGTATTSSSTPGPRANTMTAGRGGAALASMGYEELCNLEDVPTPLPRRLFERVPNVRCVPADGSCPVCLGRFCDDDDDDDDQSVVCRLPCGHHFHRACVAVWFQSKKHCCVCKREVTESSF